MIDSRLAFFQWKGAVVLTLGMEVLEGSGRPDISRLRVCTCCHQPRFKYPLNLVRYRLQIVQNHHCAAIANFSRS